VVFYWRSVVGSFQSLLAALKIAISRFACPFTELFNFGTKELGVSHSVSRHHRSLPEHELVVQTPVKPRKQRAIVDRLRNL
jgi:hypothetical protein